MSVRYDIAVIGGGVIGLSLARELAPHTASLCVVDASDEISPASCAAAGMLAPSFEEGLGADALYGLSVKSLKMWSSFAGELTGETGIDIDYRADGIWGVALDADGARELEARASELRAYGEKVRILSSGEARRQEPLLSPTVAAAMEAPDDGQVDPVKLLAALGQSVKQRGVVRLRDRLATATRQSGRWLLSLASGEVIETDQLVMATGAQHQNWPIADMRPPAIAPVKGEAFSIAGPEEGLFSRVVRAPGAYLCSKAGGRMVIGATEQPGLSDLLVDDEAIKALREAAINAAPSIANCKELSRWAGLRPGTRDGAPILGADPQIRGGGVWLALGHYRNGVLLAPASAHLLAGVMLGREEASKLKAFSPDRFD